MFKCTVQVFPRLLESINFQGICANKKQLKRELRGQVSAIIIHKKEANRLLHYILKTDRYHFSKYLLETE
jgi:hypothetical protein